MAKRNYRRRTYRRTSPLSRKISNYKTNISFARWKQRQLENSLYPADKYGRMYIPIGEDTTNTFGSNWKSATAEQRAQRRSQRYFGKGMYAGRGSFKSFMRGVGRTLAPVAKAAGKAALGAAVPIAASYLGSGAYSANNLMEDLDHAGHLQYDSPNDETGSIIIRKREYIKDLYGPTNNFDLHSFPLNPGMPNAFSWLSQLAQNYEEYQFEQLVFEYHSTTTDIGNSTTGQCGTIVMATNYNAAAKEFSDKAQMMEYSHSCSAKVTDSLTHGVECDPSKLNGDGVYYTRASSVSDDIKSYDLGNFQLAICNTPSAYANQPIGELWVYYTVRLSKPKIFGERGDGALAYKAVTLPSGYPNYTPQTGYDIVPNCVQTGSNIDIEMSNVALAGSLSGLQLKFPYDLRGAFQIMCTLSPFDGTTGANWSGMTVSSKSSNISFLSCINYGNGNTNALAPAATAATAGGLAQGAVSINMIVLYIYITDPVPGQDSQITIGKGVPQGDTEAVYMTTHVHQINDFDNNGNRNIHYIYNDTDIVLGTHAPGTYVALS